jgi:hypothetical protein
MDNFFFKYAVINYKGVQINLIPAVFSENKTKSISQIYKLNRLFQNFTNDEIILSDYYTPEEDIGSGEFQTTVNFPSEKRKRYFDKKYSSLETNF